MIDYCVGFLDQLIISQEERAERLLISRAPYQTPSTRAEYVCLASMVVDLPIPGVFLFFSYLVCSLNTVNGRPTWIQNGIPQLSNTDHSMFFYRNRICFVQCWCGRMSSRSFHSLVVCLDSDGSLCMNDTLMNPGVSEKSMRDP